MTLCSFLENELRYAQQKLLSYETDRLLKYRAEYINRLTHTIEYLEDRISDFKREHAL